MSKIIVEKPTPEKLASLGVARWPTWSKEASQFPWSFSTQEIAYILEGEVTITPNDGSGAVSFQAGDLVTFPAGLSCTWHVKKALSKHYQLG
ncbi:cupin domain-containing protein [Methylotenera sp.]|uniref:cupin domain-containing protein n=1 Tax=Methylotenera sp. TaxID=2051956 RepID=UPI00271AA8B4|nr:cupin domain-containing protein [Methylotenera sp.]MDO9204654.1 cupin domain-containing protein [Methylotenera sp.]MDO9393054.1 cupin domain-containing protein [Methylotenera sp.]MDP1522888.1 cupin domain-containing protein [Methylotenera sp.]MDP2071511.1 cupin domain-containing protein [Methylotenera sp.]MDP2231794.1 cupin domain-containing protein [Methylotenera sp.]